MLVSEKLCERNLNMRLIRKKKQSSNSELLRKKKQNILSAHFEKIKQTNEKRHNYSSRNTFFYFVL